MVRTPGLVVAAVILASSPAADADVLVLYGDVQGGGMFGRGTSGDEAVKDQAFFSRVPNLTYGFAVSGRFLFLGGTIAHRQYVGPRIDDEGSGEKPALATWTQLTVGVDFAIDVGGSETVVSNDKNKKKERKGGFIHVAAGAGFGVGTGQQVDPPLDNEQIDDKAFLLEGRIGFGKHLGKHSDIGLQIPVSYGYFFKNGVPANNLDNHYQGLHVQALVFLRLYLKLL